MLNGIIGANLVFASMKVFDVWMGAKIFLQARKIFPAENFACCLARFCFDPKRIKNRPKPARHSLQKNFRSHPNKEFEIC